MRIIRNKIFLIALFIIILLSLFLIAAPRAKLQKNVSQLSPNPTGTVSPTPSPIPDNKTLNSSYHIFQTFNNCGPASLSMALFYYGENVSQKELGDSLRPFQNSNGDNDDKSVTLAELAEKAKEFDLIPFHRPNGNIEIIKNFIALGYPVITRTWTKPNEDIGHFRVIKGYDDTVGEIIQDDSLQGKNLHYKYEEFNILWEKFNYEYLVLIPQAFEAEAKETLGSDANEKYSWQKAVELSRTKLRDDPLDIYARFNLSVAYYNTGDYENSVSEFEKVEGKLPFRTLWYQIEPILAYYKLGNYERVFGITNKILNSHNRAFSELYIIRGNIYKKRGEDQLAESEFQKAVLYNKNINLQRPDLI